MIQRAKSLGPRTLSDLRELLTVVGRLIAPLLIGSFIIGLVVHTLYFGGKRQSLVAMAETSIIRAALKGSAYDASPASPVQIISALNSDFEQLEASGHPNVKDLSIAEYARLVEAVASREPRMIFVSWLTNAHRMTSEHLAPITEVIDRLGISGKLVMGVQLSTSGSIPEDLARKYQIAEARDCYYDVNSFCTFNPNLTWIPQKVAELMWTNPKGWALSTNLPHFWPNYILNLPRPQSMKPMTFDQVIRDASPIKRDAVVFIGNDITQPSYFSSNKEILQKTFVPLLNTEQSLMDGGIPFHHFWALMAQMFHEGKTVRVAPEWLNFSVMGLVFGGIVFAIVKMGWLALGPFLLMAIALPLLSVVAVKWWGFYFPVVTIEAAGSSIFAAALFLTVSLSAYERWRLRALELRADATLDIKTNFISLLSHNLNTPIAQLRGLVEMLAQAIELRSRDMTNSIDRMNWYIELMRVGVKVVLISSSVETQVDPNVRMTPKRLIDSFFDESGGILKRLGLTVVCTPDPQDDEWGGVWYYRFPLPPKFLGIVVLCGLLDRAVAEGTSRLALKVSCQFDDPEEPGYLALDLSGVEIDGSVEGHESFRGFLDPGLERDFLTAVLSRFFSSAESMSTVSWIRHEQSLSIRIVESKDLK